jgi:hypothetical protein
MDLQTRKIAFIQEFLKIESEETISDLEQILKHSGKSGEDHLKPLTIEELNERINRSEADFKNDRFKPSAEVLSKY